MEILLGGRIDTTPDTIVIDDRYAYYLDGTFRHEEEFLLRDLLRFKDQWAIESHQGDTVKLVSPFQPWWESKPGGERVIKLERSREYLPVSGESLWDGGNAEWRIERFSVEAVEQVDGMWMPTHIKEEIASSASPETLAAYDR